MTQSRTDFIGADLGALTSVDDLVWLAGSAPDAALDELGNRPIHYAAKHGSKEAITQIIALGASPTITNLEGQRASDVARSAGHIEVALVLRSYERKTETANQDQSEASVKLEKRSGDFSPTPTTNLLNEDVDWQIPDDLSDDMYAESHVSEMHRVNQEIEFISTSTSAQANVMLWCLYSRVKDLFKNLKPLIEELNKTGKTISHKNYDGVFESYFYPFWKIKDLVQESKSENQSFDDILNNILSICENEIEDSDRVESLISAIQMDSAQNANHIINVIRMISSFADMFDGDLFDNRESGDQDLLNPNIKLVPPVFEATEKFEKECEQFLNEWGKNFVESTKWDDRHWILPD